jgi:hypothetical protein
LEHVIGAKLIVILAREKTLDGIDGSDDVAEALGLSSQ